MARPSAAPLTGENLRGVELPGGTVVINQRTGPVDDDLPTKP